MKPTDPPVVATALLELFLPSRTARGLIGDLIEERRHGRSRTWYWRQTIVALVTSARHEVRDHWPQAISAIVLGYLCGASVFYVATAGAARFIGGYTAYLVFLPLGFLSAAMSGWILSRTHSRRMVLVFALFCVTASVVAFAVYASLPLDRLPLLELSFFAALDFVVWPVGVLAGGLYSAADTQAESAPQLSASRSDERES